MTVDFRMKGWAFYMLTCARSMVRRLGLVLRLFFATCSQKLDAELFLGDSEYLCCKGFI